MLLFFTELEIFKTIMVKEINKVSKDGGVVTQDVVKRIISEAEEVRAAKRPRIENLDNVDI